MYTDREPQRPSASPRRLRAALAAATSISLLATGCSEPAKSSHEDRCDAFNVYAQNVWPPIGSAERQLPDLRSAKVASHAGKAAIKVDGWVHTGTPVYPHNPEPWNSDIWFRVVDGKWVNFASVRGVENTTPDPTGHGSGGPPAPTPPECEIAYVPTTPSQPASTT